jgi:hypothetical protein
MVRRAEERRGDRLFLWWLYPLPIETRLGPPPRLGATCPLGERERETERQAEIEAGRQGETETKREMRRRREALCSLTLRCVGGLVENGFAHGLSAISEFLLWFGNRFLVWLLHHGLDHRGQVSLSCIE